MYHRLDYSRLSVLVLEDEMYTRQLILRMLRDIGVRTITDAADGKSGLMQLVRTRPDVVLCDIHMKPMNGLQFLQGVRSIPLNGVNLTPVIFLTGDNSLEAVQAAGWLQAAGYLVKPVSIARLRERLDAVIGERPELLARLTHR